MSVLSIIVLVCFVMVMFLWLLSMLGAVPNAANYSPWLAWFACLFLPQWRRISPRHLRHSLSVTVRSRSSRVLG